MLSSIFIILSVFAFTLFASFLYQFLTIFLFVLKKVSSFTSHKKNSVFTLLFNYIMFYSISHIWTQMLKIKMNANVIKTQFSYLLKYAHKGHWRSPKDHNFFILKQKKLFLRFFYLKSDLIKICYEFYIVWSMSSEVIEGH